MAFLFVEDLGILVRLEAHVARIGRLEHGALDHRREFQHQRGGAGCVRDGRLARIGQAAPCRAFLVDERFPVQVAQPVLHGGGIEPLLLEVVENEVLLLVGQPSARLFDCVAVGDAVECNFLHGIKWLRSFGIAQ